MRISPDIGAEVSDLQMPKMWSNGADGKRGRVMIPEREREALMRLTMCAREECRVCMYQKRCDFDFQCELATKNMNILANALRADRKTENCSEIPNNSTISKMEQVETMSCQECKHFHENAVMYLDQCDYCFKDCKYEPKDEPQTERSE